MRLARALWDAIALTLINALLATMSDEAVVAFGDVAARGMADGRGDTAHR